VVTVSTASDDVALPNELVAIARKRAPLSPDVTVEIVYDVEVAPVMFVPLRCQR
jgi:hypothetical protein